MLETLNKFRDRNGGLWSIVLTKKAIRTVKRFLGVDLTDEVGGGLLDPEMPVHLKRRVLFAVMADAIKARGLNEFTVQELFDDAAILCAMESLTWSILDANDYLPEDVEKMKAAIGKMIEASREYQSLFKHAEETRKTLVKAEAIRDRLEAGLGIES